MSRFATWGVGDWVMFGISVLISGFRPRLMQNDPRTTGMIFLGLGAFLLMRQLAVF